MPAVSERQRRYIFGVKGEAFARRHHFDNKGKLPEKVSKGHAVRALSAAVKRHRKKKAKK